LRSRFESIGIGKGHPSVSPNHGRRVFSHDQVATPATPSLMETASSSRSMYLAPVNHSRVRSLSNPNASDVELANRNEVEVDLSHSRRSSGIRASPSTPDLVTPFQRDEPPHAPTDRNSMLLDATNGFARNAASLSRRSPPPRPTVPKPANSAAASPFASPPSDSNLEFDAPVRVSSPASDHSVRRPPPPPPPRRISDHPPSEDLADERSQPSGVASLRAKFVR
jgi:hypothetical protein